MNKATDILEGLSEAIIVVNSDKEISFVNSAFEKLFGHKLFEVQGKSLDYLIPSKYHDQHENKVASFFGNPSDRKMGKGLIVEALHKNKTSFPIEVSLSYTKIDGEQVAVAILKNFSDIIAQKKKAEDRQLLYESIVENSSDHIFKIDSGFKILYINHVAPGLTKQDVIGTKILELLTDNGTREKVCSILEGVFKSGDKASYDIEFPSPLGTLYYETTVNPIISNGIVVGASLVSRDLTNKIKLEKELIEKNNFIKKIEESSFNGVYVFNIVTQKNEFINKQYTNLLGYNLEDMNSLSPDEFLNLFHEEDLDSILAHMGEVTRLKPGEFSEITYRFRAKNGDWRWCYSKDTGFEFDEKGNLISFMGAFVDITEQKEAEFLLLKKNDELENFAAIAAHDLKSPLNTIHVLLDIISKNLGEEINPKVVTSIKKVYQSITRMGGLIEALLDYSTLEQELDLGEVDTNKVSQQVIADLEEAIVSSKADIILENLPKLNKANEPGIARVLQNLISNSIKFRDKEREVLITISCKEYPDEFQFKISDNGIGINNEHKGKIFNFLQKLHSQKKISGHGIGLSTCQKIINFHGGKIWVER